MSVIAIFGPTGSGKTQVATLVARALGTVVINTDPAQCYDALDILSNKPTPEHDQVAAHALINIWDSGHEATVGEFAALARDATDECIAQSGSAVLCGGSGLYLLASVTNLDLAPAGGVGVTAQADPDLAQKRIQIEELVAKHGSRAAHTQLAAVDPLAADRIHPNDSIRLVRALELAEQGHSTPSSSGSIWDAPLRSEHTILVHLKVDRKLMHQRINSRAQEMFAGGALDEVAKLDAQISAGTRGCSVTFDKIHGLTEARMVLCGDLTAAQAAERMATRSRQYAKRQDTWARRWPQMRPINHDPADPDATVGQILRLAQIIHDDQ